MAYAISVQLNSGFVDIHSERLMAKILWAIEPYGFTAVQPHLYVGTDDLSKLYQAINALQEVQSDAVWINDHIASVKAFRMDAEITDFTGVIRDGIKRNYQDRMERLKLQEEAEAKSAKAVKSSGGYDTRSGGYDTLNPRPNWEAPREYPRSKDEWITHISSYCKF